MATDPAAIAAGIQGVRLLIAAAGDIAALVDRWQSQDRPPTDEELLLLATRREEEDRAYDALLRSLGVEPGTGRRIPKESQR